MTFPADSLPDLHLSARDRDRLEAQAGVEMELRTRRAANPFTGMARPLELRGNVKAAQGLSEREVCLVGPAGTSKTVGNLQKVHKCCLKYPGARWLLLRKFRADLTESVLETYENIILPPGSVIIGKQKRDQRRAYRYPNGSMIVCGGMDLATRLFSVRYDGVYCNELIEFDQGDYETLLRALRSFVQPFRQILSDTNPGPPNHWIRQRAESGKLTLLETWHRDNPFYWDAQTDDYTPAGREYIEDILSGLTGVRRERLLLGRWAAAEGVIYESWQPNIHHIEAKKAPYRLYKTARFVWSVDFGYYPDPFVWQCWLVDAEGRMYLIREIYQTKRIIKELAKDIIALTAGLPKPEAIVCDHDGQGRATLEDALKMPTIPAYKPILEGIQNVEDRLTVRGDGLPRLMIVQGCTWRRDIALKKAGRPTSSAEEKESYVWHPSHKKQIPMDKDNHGMDALRYAAAYVDGLRAKGQGGEGHIYRDVYGGAAGVDVDDEDAREFSRADFREVRGA